MMLHGWRVVLVRLVLVVDYNYGLDRSWSDNWIGWKIYYDDGCTTVVSWLNVMDCVDGIAT